MAGRLYLDHNATAPLRPEARTAVFAALDEVGNASSVHGEGRAARGRVEDARELVAGLVGAQPAEVVFTSGATEANNWAIRAGWRRIYVGGIEHDSVLAAVAVAGAERVEVPVCGNGLCDLGAFAASILQSPADGPDLLTLQMANNETGVLQELAAAAEFCRAHQVALHSDAVQAAGRVAIRFRDLGLDLMSLSSHKIGGPMGVGALVIRNGFKLTPQIVGGGQERRRRSGTENVPAIAGFGAAAAAAARELETMDRLRALRDRFAAAIREITPEALFLVDDAARLANTISVAVPGQQAETLVIKLDLAGLAVSAGSACSSGKVGVSHVLSAMGLPPEIARAAIRISLGWNTSEADLEPFSTRWRSVFAPAASRAQSSSRAVA